MKTHYLLSGLLGLALSLCCGCSNEDAPIKSPENNTPAVSLSISSVGNGSISRATEPSYEYGFDNENTIVDAIIVLYSKPLNSGEGSVYAAVPLSSYDLGEATTYSSSTSTTANINYYDRNGNAVAINSPNKIVAKRYYVDHRANALATVLKSLPENQPVYAIALANMGSSIDGIRKGMRVSELRDFVYKGDLYKENYYPNETNLDNQTVSNTVINAGYFAMSAINEVKFVPSEVLNGEDYVITEEFMVQRLAARIDISFGIQAVTDGHTIHSTDISTGTGSTGTYLYDVQTDGKTYTFPIYSEEEYQANINGTDAQKYKRITGAEYKLKEIELINCVNKGEYLFEKTNNAPHWLGNEGGWTNGKANNFIYSDPDRTYRTSGMLTNYDKALDTYTTNGKSAWDVIHHGLKKPNPRTNHLAAVGDPKFGVYSILGYVGENTFASDYVGDLLYTGIRLAGTTNVGAHFAGSAITVGNDTKAVPMEVSVDLRHSFGARNTNPLYYATVRNTIYRLYVRFFAESNKIIARWYYYNGADNAFAEVQYTPMVIAESVVDSNNQPPTND